jgi:hypothetical protein
MDPKDEKFFPSGAIAFFGKRGRAAHRLQG